MESEHKLTASNLRLIAYGKVMDDNEKSLSDYSIKEGDFLVAMVQKVSFIFIMLLA